jgi:hypothetical protein
MERAADESDGTADRHLEAVPSTYDASSYNYPPVEPEPGAHPDYEQPLPGLEEAAGVNPPDQPRKPRPEPVEF